MEKENKDYKAEFTPPRLYTAMDRIRSIESQTRSITNTLKRVSEISDEALHFIEMELSEALMKLVPVNFACDMLIQSTVNQINEEAK